MGKFKNFLLRDMAEQTLTPEEQRHADFVLCKDDLGMTDDSQFITERSAMRISSVYSCVRVLSEDFASLPLHLYRQEGKYREKATMHPLYDLLYIKPNDEMSSFTLREVGMTNLLLWGNCYIQKIYDKAGNIHSLWPLLSERMRVERDNNTDEIKYYYTPRKGATVTLTRKDVLHIPGLSFDGLTGLSPIGLARKSLYTAKAAQVYGSKFFENGARPGGVLEHPGTLENPDRIRESWNEVYKGAANSHSRCTVYRNSKVRDERNLQNIPSAATHGRRP